MRILNVTQAYYPFLDKGGPATKVRAITRALALRGNQVTVLTADLGFGPREIAAARVVGDSQGWRTDLDGVEVIYFRTRCHYRNLTVNPGVLRFCRRRLKEFDIVHMYGLYDTLGPAVGHYCRKLRVPYFVEPLGMTRPIDRGFLLKRIWRRLAGNYLGQASKWIATSELEREDLRAAGIPSGKVQLRFNGIDREEFKKLPPFGAFRKNAGIPDDERLILFLGRLIPRKGADLLIEALPQIGGDKLKLVIAGPEGESGYLAFLRDKARTLGVDQRVLFPGPLYEDLQKEALIDATVFALPSRYENFGNTAAEAIACGTPVVVSDRCGIAPLVDQRAGLVTSYDSQAVARTLKELLTNPALYQRLRAGCPQVAEEISWEGLVRGMQDSYEKTRNDFLQLCSHACAL
ncbi:MAG TPA: glycosyltransferase [Terriglobia bacterium]|nr:glycosyltransferase [Terriglobia bacterium]